MSNTIIKWKDCVGEGWFPIVEEAIIEIESRGGFILQVKEKFGGLRIYSQGGDYDAISEIVRKAEVKASRICEDCGEPGVLHNKNGWYKTVCDDHVK